MNGIPVYPHPKNGERPYLAVPEPAFSGLFLGLFLHFLSCLPSDLSSCLIKQPTPIYFILFYILQLNPHQVRSTLSHIIPTHPAIISKT